MIGVIEYTNYEPLSNKPFNIHYYIPSTINQTTAPILFIFPGTDRNADDYLETWITLADQKGVMVSHPTVSSNLLETRETMVASLQTRRRRE